MNDYKALFSTHERYPRPLDHECIPPRVQKHSPTMLMEAPSCPFSSEITYVDSGGSVCHRWILFFLSSPSKIIVWPFLLLVFQLQFLFIWFFFYFWPFYKSFICFQSHPSILIRYILFFQFNPQFFDDFWALLLN
jgi:hypothetical protein